MKQTIATFLLGMLCLPVFSSIDRHSVISRNNPHVETIDSLSSLTVGNGGFAFKRMIGCPFLVAGN